MELDPDGDGVEVRLVDRDEYASQTTGRVEQGEAIEVADELASHLTRRRGFEHVDEDGGGLEELEYRELQQLAQDHDIPANQSADDLIEQIREAQTEDNE